MRNQLRGLALAAIVVFGASVNLQTAQASQTVYVAGSGGEFGTINLTTGAFTAIGPGLDLGNGNTIFGMGFGSNGNLYGVDSGSPSNLFEINTTTGVATPSGGIALSDSAIGAVPTPAANFTSSTITRPVRCTHSSRLRRRRRLSDQLESRAMAWWRLTPVGPFSRASS